MGKNIIIVSIAALMIFIGCEETDYPDSLYNPDEVYGDSPVITAVLPAEGVYAGIDDITIAGENFSGQPQSNFVYFDGVLAELLSYSTTELVVRAPIMESDSITVKVSTVGQNALAFGEYEDYKIQYAAIGYGGVTDQTDAKGIAVDNDENVYVSNNTLRKIIKIPADGSDPIDFALTPDGSFITMKIGPNGILYGGRTKFIYQVNLTDSTVARFGDRLGQALKDMDFGPNGNLYTASKKFIYRMKPDGIVTEAFNSTLPSLAYYTYSSIRVYDNYIYVSGNILLTDTTVVQEGIWRHQIISADSIGPAELVFDWADYVGEFGPNITAITFSSDGLLYVGASDGDAILILEPSGDDYTNSIPQPLYPSVLLPPSTNFSWGSGEYLYVNRSSTNTELMRLIRISTGKESAVYWGREL